MSTLKRSAGAKSVRCDKVVDHEQGHHQDSRDGCSSGLDGDTSHQEGIPLEVSPLQLEFDFDQDPPQVLLQIHHKGILLDKRKPMMSFRFRAFPEEAHERFAADAGIVAPHTTETATIVLKKGTHHTDDTAHSVTHVYMPEYIIMECCPVSTALARSYSALIQAEGREEADKALHHTWDAAHFFLEEDHSETNGDGGGLPHVSCQKLFVKCTCSHKPHRDKLAEYLVDVDNCPLHRQIDPDLERILRVDSNSEHEHGHS